MGNSQFMDNLPARILALKAIQLPSLIAGGYVYNCIIYIYNYIYIYNAYMYVNILYKYIYIYIYITYGVFCMFLRLVGNLHFFSKWLIPSALRLKELTKWVLMDRGWNIHRCDSFDDLRVHLWSDWPAKRSLTGRNRFCFKARARDVEAEWPKRAATSKVARPSNP